MENRGLILLIEDDDLFRESLTRILEREGFSVEYARKGREAIEIAKDKDISLIISDIRLADNMDGIEAVKKIKEFNPSKKIPVIVMTAYSDDDAPVRALKAGVDDYIYKPIALDYFMLRIKKIMDVANLQRQEKEYIKEIRRMKDELAQYNIILENKVRDKASELTLLFEIGKELTSSSRLDEVLHTIVERTSEVLKVERCSLLLLDEDENELFIAAAKGLSHDVIAGTHINMGEKISGWILENKSPVLVDDIEKDERFKSRSKEMYYTHSFISVPLIFKGKGIGVINVNNKRSREVFSKDDLHLVEGIADQASIAVENARLYSNLKGVYLQVVAALTSIVDIKDHYTRGHCERVTNYAVEIARKMNLPSKRIEVIRLASQLHDLGKIGVRESILTKPGKLTEEEWEEVKLHPARGVEILKPLTFLNDVMELVEHHHEHYDGKGYPEGQKGGNIELGARILAVADSFDAMTTKRSYANALSLDEAIEELKKCSGTQFDPQVVEAFIKLLKENPRIFSK